MARLFVALEVPDRVGGPLGDVVQGIAAEKRVAPSPLHVTLRFLGEQGGKETEVLQERIEEIGARLATVRYTGFACSVRGLGCFPVGRPGSARVLFAHLHPGAPLAGLKAAVDAVLGPDPEVKGRGFTPHLTLARFAKPPGAPVEGALSAHAGLHLGPWPVEAISLFESVTSPKGAQYRVLARFALDSVGPPAFREPG